MVFTVKGRCLFEALGLVQCALIWHTNTMDSLDFPRLPFRLRSMSLLFGTSRSPDKAVHLTQPSTLNP